MKVRAYLKDVLGNYWFNYNAVTKVAPVDRPKINIQKNDVESAVKVAYNNGLLRAEIKQYH